MEIMGKIRGQKKNLPSKAWLVHVFIPIFTKLTRNSDLKYVGKIIHMKERLLLDRNEMHSPTVKGLLRGAVNL